MVLLNLLLLDDAILPRPPRADQSTERHRRAGMSEAFTPIRLAKSAGIKKAPLTSRGLFSVLKPVPD
jgi:hypothetical protein